MNEPSSALFVRGKYQLARYEPGSAAIGRRLTEFEARKAYGNAVFAEINEHLSAVLLRSRGVIENALRTQRENLGVTIKNLASAANVGPHVVETAEVNADRIEIRQLEHLAFVLGLDPLRLSVEESSGADTDLGVRLRVLEQVPPTDGGTRLTPRTVLRFSEAASIIRSQSSLQDWLKKPEKASGFEPSSDFGPPTWRSGYRLAQHARQRLGIGSLDPIPSMRDLVERRLGIPIVQVELPSAIAGATISSHDRRGIVLNVTGANANIWIRRTTLAHELAHILFDTEARLESVRVDSYQLMDRNTEDDGPHDEVEQRANAFAVEFLAPREAVKLLVPDVANVRAEAIERVVSKFGIGRVAARFHVGNAWYRQAELPSESSIRATPTDEQRAAEDFTLDFFPIPGTPEQRRGRLAVLTVEAVEAGLITSDSAAQYLGCSEQEFESALPHLRNLAGGDPDLRQ